MKENGHLANISNEYENQEIIRIIESCPFFKEFEKEEIISLASIACIKKNNKNSNVFTVNQNGKSFYILAEGDLQLNLKSGKKKNIKPFSTFGEISILTEYGRMGTIKALEATKLVAMEKKDIFDSNKLPIELILKLTKKMSRQMAGYLAEGNTYVANVEFLIKQGEGTSIEFKKSFSKTLRPKIYETITALINTEGGTIIIGVRDNKKIIGIEDKGYNYRDELSNNVISAINKKFGSHVASLVSVDFTEFKGKLLMRIDCQKSFNPVFIKGTKANPERFVIRNGATNLELDKMAFHCYMKKREM